MSSRIFPTPQDAEAAFYQSIERADLETMMSVWAEDEEIVCIHPGGEMLSGVDQVRESWRRIFAGSARLQMQVSLLTAMSGVMFAVRTVQEAIAVAGDPKQKGLVAATNVYLRTAAGWRMIVHHASPSPSQLRGTAARGSPNKPSTLH